MTDILRVSRPIWKDGTRRIFRYCSRTIFKSGKNCLGYLRRDWVPTNRSGTTGHIGFYWEDLGGNFSRTFVTMKDALADFGREITERMEATCGNCGCGLRLEQTPEGE